MVLRVGVEINPLYLGLVVGGMQQEIEALAEGSTGQTEIVAILLLIVVGIGMILVNFSSVDGTTTASVTHLWSAYIL